MGIRLYMNKVIRAGHRIRLQCILSHDVYIILMQADKNYRKIRGHSFRCCRIHRKLRQIPLTCVNRILDERKKKQNGRVPTAQKPCPLCRNRASLEK